MGGVLTAPRHFKKDDTLPPPPGGVEARGCERFTTLAGALEDPALRDFYTEIAQSEARHETLFVDLAAEYFSSEEIAARLSFWIDQDAQILSRLPAQPILH